MPTPSRVSPVDTCEINHIHADGVRRARRALPDPDVADDLSALFGALGDPTRVRLLAVLTTGPLCVCDLAATLGVSQSAVSHQLRLLRSLHLVRARRGLGHMMLHAYRHRWLSNVASPPLIPPQTRRGSAVRPSPAG